MDVFPSVPYSVDVPTGSDTTNDVFLFAFLFPAETYQWRWFLSGLMCVSGLITLALHKYIFSLCIKSVGNECI